VSDSVVIVNTWVFYFTLAFFSVSYEYHPCSVMKEVDCGYCLPINVYEYS